MADTDEADEKELAGRCNFCGAELRDDADTCAECGRGTDEGLVFRPRRPIWARVLAWLVIAMLAVLAVSMIVRAIKGG